MDREGAESDFHLEPSSNAATDRLASLSSMRQQGEFCDVTVEAEDGFRVSAHRVVLASCSPYFRAMFLGDLAESRQEVVSLKGIDSDILEAVVSYAYNDGISLSSDRVLSLLITADLLQIQPLFAECCSHLETQLRPDNCLSLRVFADRHNCQHLFQLSNEFASVNFEQVVKCEEFLSLPSTQLRELISRDEVRVSSEEKVYSAVLQWVYHDLENRRGEFASIMSHVRLPFVSLEFLSSEVEREDLMQTEDKCKEFLEEAHLYKSSPEKRPSLRQSPRARPRKASGLQDVILVAGGMGKREPLSSIEQYDVHSDSWSHLTDMEMPHYGLRACYNDGCLYTIGGYSETFGYLNSVACYNLRDDSWSMVAPMHTPRRYHDVEVLYGLLYVSGGQSLESILKSVERYNPSDDTWVAVSPMQTARMYHGLTESGGFLFAVGGHEGQRRLSSVECYNPELDQWAYVSSMNVARSVVGVASLGGLVYAVGGYNGRQYLDSVEYYDTELDKWSSGPTMSSQRSALALVTYCGCLYACGGFNGSFTSSVERLAIGREAWEPVVNMQLGRVHFGATCT